MLKLYLIRHGLAGEYGSYFDDRVRPLTLEGQQKTHKVAKKLLNLGLKFDLILSSPLLRAKETAEILQQVGLSSQLETSKLLSPEGDLSSWLEWLNQWMTKSSDCSRDKLGQRTLALVGHEPNLSNWAETLLWGKAENKFILKKAGIIGLILPEQSPIGNSQVFWVTNPKLLL
jgi:phosphohistidine phosphatase